MSIIFWFSFISIFYAYIGYLGILMVVRRFKKKAWIKDDSFLPSVSLIVAAYNEERVIRRKIEESLNLDYPNDKIEIIVASDCSNDKTDEIVSSYAGQRVFLVRNSKHSGKTVSQNFAVQQAKGEILVFSDATTIFKKDALSKLMKNFKDPMVGCVGGQERFIKSESGIFEEATFFWRYEKLIRSYESDFNTLIGVSGCIFAIRKELYEELDKDLIEDFSLPLKLASRGFKVVHESRAIAYENAAEDTKTELARKARIVAGGINVVYKMRHLLNPLRYPLLSFQIISHKILRWLAPVFMLSLFVSNIFLLRAGMFYILFMLAQALFYFLVIMAAYFIKGSQRQPKLLRLVYHFCFVNTAAILGIVKFLRDSRQVIWEPAR